MIKKIRMMTVLWKITGPHFGVEARKIGDRRRMPEVLRKKKQQSTTYLLREACDEIELKKKKVMRIDKKSQNGGSHVEENGSSIRGRGTGIGLASGTTQQSKYYLWQNRNRNKYEMKSEDEK